MDTWYQVLISLVVALVFWFPQNVFHEGCHALVVEFLEARSLHHPLCLVDEAFMRRPFMILPAKEYWL